MAETSLSTKQVKINFKVAPENTTKIGQTASNLLRLVFFSADTKRADHNVLQELYLTRKVDSETLGLCYSYSRDGRYNTVINLIITHDKNEAANRTLFNAVVNNNGTITIKEYCSGCWEELVAGWAADLKTIIPESLDAPDRNIGLLRLLQDRMELKTSETLRTG
jgi:hypothetical protein